MVSPEDFRTCGDIDRTFTLWSVENTALHANLTWVSLLSVCSVVAGVSSVMVGMHVMG